MRAVLTCCWPGLTRLWFRGEWAGLATATLFAALLNLAVVARFIWPDLLSAKLAIAIWCLVGVTWLVGFIRSIGLLGQLRSSGRQRDADSFGEAMSEYLCGHWFEAEAILRQMLLNDSRDLEAQLLLGSVLRHTQRYDEARNQLDALERLDGSRKWQLEILQERSRLQQAESRESSDLELESELAEKSDTDASEQPTESRDAA